MSYVLICSLVLTLRYKKKCSWLVGL